jgi:hypothetical protein
MAEGDLTPERKAEIDALTHYELLRAIRFAPPGDARFVGEAGKYWIKRRSELQSKDPEQAVRDSKDLGWG